MEHAIDLARLDERGADDELLRHILEGRNQELYFNGCNVLGELVIAVDRARRTLAAASNRTWTDVQAVEVRCAVYDNEEMAIYLDVSLVLPPVNDGSCQLVHRQIRCGKDGDNKPNDFAHRPFGGVRHTNDLISAREWLNSHLGDGIDLQHCLWIPSVTLAAARSLL